MIHGFPDFWYSWRKQMRALAENGYRAVAVDLRGYNLSDKPKGVDVLNCYKANYPKPDAPPRPASFTFPQVKVPVLMFHGLEDQALLPGALNGTRQWVEQDLTIVAIPGASHFVQQDAANMVSNTTVDWLARRIRK